MRIVYFILVFLICTLSVSSQTLLPGMAVMTQMPEDTANDYVVHVYDTRNVVIASTAGNNWAMNTLLPSSSVNASQWKVSRMGAVFGVTTDTIGNMYVCAGNMYNYSFAPGYVPGTAGSGGIYRINANDWSVSDFVTTYPGPVSTNNNQLPNTGPGLGNICYDKWHNQLFVTNFEDGKIYRIDMNGTILSSFDPFTADNNLAGIAPAGERPWGIGVYQDQRGETRVYFGNWTTDLITPSVHAAPFDKNSVWSVGLDNNGNFTGTEQFEFALPDNPRIGGASMSAPPSCINFSSDGRMLIAERSMKGTDHIGAHASRWLEFTKTGTGWQIIHLYNVGNYSWTSGTAMNSAGGADYGYADSDPSDQLNGCEQLVWGTADAIRFDGYNPDAGDNYVYGLTAIPESGNSTDQNAADFVCNTSYMIDANNSTFDIPKTNMGSVSVVSNCQYNPCENYNCKMINVLTPNEDGINDFLVLDCNRAGGWKLEVFNRWGERMYYSEDYANDWNCAGLTAGVYYYIVSPPCEGGKHVTGFFHLLSNRN